jgi:hypothetical protein
VILLEGRKGIPFGDRIVRRYHAESVIEILRFWDCVLEDVALVRSGS